MIKSKTMYKIVVFIILEGFIMLIFNSISVIAEPDNTRLKAAKIGVLLYDFKDMFIAEVKKNLEEIQKENEKKVEFTFLMERAI